MTDIFMNRPTRNKQAQQAALKADLSAFLDAGGVIEHLPGFNQKPTLDKHDPKRLSTYADRVDHYVVTRNLKGRIPPEKVELIKQDIKNGLSINRITELRKVGTSIVTKCRDQIKSEQERERRLSHEPSNA